LRRGPRYDCRPLTRRQLVALLEAHAFEPNDLSREAIRVMQKVESPTAPTRFALRLSETFFPLARPVLPTFIFLARRR
jgi:hypothetical protein